MCDGFDHSDYPIFVPADKNIHEAKKKYDGVNMQRVMEVYWLGGDIEQQLAAFRSFTYAPEDQPKP